jgi:hypothetical protein
MVARVVFDMCFPLERRLCGAPAGAASAMEFMFRLSIGIFVETQIFRTVERLTIVRRGMQR